MILSDIPLEPRPVLLITHVGAGSLALLSGFTALAPRKGETAHRGAGTVFFVAMLVMTGAAATLALQKMQPANLLAAALTAYLVVTARATVRRPEGVTGLFEVGAMFTAGAIATAGYFLGLAHIAPFGAAVPASSGDYSIVYYAFASVALLAALLDMRVGLARGLSGSARVSRHLWRMCLALFVASGSFFLGQMKVIPIELRGPHLYILAFAPLLALVFWMIRIRFQATRDPAPETALTAGA